MSGEARPSEGRRRYALALSVALLVLLASVVDPPTGSGVTPTGPFGLGADKYLHAAAYAAVAFSLAWARGARTAGALVVVVCVVATYGAGIELVQATIPARSFDPLDGVANTVGSVAGVLTYAGRSLRGR